MSWVEMRSRCNNPNRRMYSRYGGRGIRVCKRWAKFEAFFADMGRRPTLKHTLERKKNALGYTKSNCVWATRADQARNNSRTRHLTLGSVTMCIAEWARTLGLSRSTIVNRLAAGYPIAQVLSRERLPMGPRRT